MNMEFRPTVCQFDAFLPGAGCSQPAAPGISYCQGHRRHVYLPDRRNAAARELTAELAGDEPDPQPDPDEETPDHE
jgi:hypothetical protein